jgi:hypothetical protein
VSKTPPDGLLEPEQAQELGRVLVLVLVLGRVPLVRVLVLGRVPLVRVP